MKNFKNFLKYSKLNENSTIFEKENAQHYRADSERLLQSALDAAKSAQQEMSGRIGPKNVSHISALSAIARSGVNALISKSIREAAPNFVKDAKEYLRNVSPGTKPSDIGASSAFDVLPSLMTHGGVRTLLQSYDVADMKQRDLEGRGDLRASTEHAHVADLNNSPLSGSQFYIDNDLMHTSMADANLYRGADQFGLWHHKLRTGSDISGQEHARSKLPETTAEIEKLSRQMKSKGQEGFWSQYAAETSMVDSIRRATDYINAIPGLSKEQQEQLHQHFGTQFRHHYVAGIANPQKFSEYHAGRTSQEQEAAGRAREQAREKARESGGSSRRRDRWEYAEKPNEILGVAANASISDVRAAFRKLAAQHHPDVGGDPSMFIKAKDAHDQMMRGLNEWVTMIAEWVTKRHKY